MSQGYRFIFQRGATTRVPFHYRTVNDDGSRSAINLSDKRVSIRFQVRGAAADLLFLDSSQATNSSGAKLEITNAADGKFQIVVPTAQIDKFLAGSYGEWELLLIESDGESSLLADGAFSVR